MESAFYMPFLPLVVSLHIEYKDILSTFKPLLELVYRRKSHMLNLKARIIPSRDPSPQIARDMVIA